MSHYRLSREAAADIDYIGARGISRFGLEQALKYHLGLESRFELLAQFPRMGTPIYDLRPGLYHFLYEAHMIFYLIEPDDILIVRVLYAAADFKRHF